MKARITSCNMVFLQTVALNFYGGINDYEILYGFTKTEQKDAKKLVDLAKKIIFGELKSYNN